MTAVHWRRCATPFARKPRYLASIGRLRRNPNARVVALLVNAPSLVIGAIETTSQPSKPNLLSWETVADRFILKSPKKPPFASIVTVMYSHLVNCRLLLPYVRLTV